MKNRTPYWTVLLSAAAIAGLGMGLRQVIGLYQKPVTEALGLGRSDFALAVGVANLVWGFAAPITGAVSDRFGAGRVSVFGALCTGLGLLMMYDARTRLGLCASGILLGLGVAGAGVNALVGAVARAAPPERRIEAIAALGMGSGIGVFLAIPYAHLLIEKLGWQASLLVLASMTTLMLPLAWAVRGKREAPAPGGAPSQSLRDALIEAANSRSFWLLNAGFFVCGFHVVFYGTHLPSYVADQGLTDWVAIAALTVVGAGNLAGTYLAGRSSRIVEKRIGLSLIYLGRALVFLGFLLLPITPTTVIALSAALGLLWLSTVPLTSGLVATFFGSHWMTMLYGIVFLSHQLGSFTGAWLGGYVYDQTKSYQLMWEISVVLGLLAALLHWPIVERPVRRLKSGEPADRLATAPAT